MPRGRPRKNQRQQELPKNPLPITDTVTTNSSGNVVKEVSSETTKTEDVNKMEEQTAKAKRSINSLTDEIEKIKSVMKDSQSFTMFEKLGNQEFVSAKEVENITWNNANKLFHIITD